MKSIEIRFIRMDDAARRTRNLHLRISVPTRSSINDFMNLDVQLPDKLYE